MESVHIKNTNGDEFLTLSQRPRLDMNCNYLVLVITNDSKVIDSPICGTIKTMTTTYSNEKSIKFVCDFSNRSRTSSSSCS